MKRKGRKREPSREEFGEYCAEMGFHRGAVSIDCGVPADVIARVGFSGLIDLLRLPEFFGVLGPNLGHLSEVDAAGTSRASKIRSTASRGHQDDEYDEEAVSCRTLLARAARSWPPTRGGWRWRRCGGTAPGR
ncbi:hypothetical protein GCM10022243_37560 [Saccharothrix violaceirubra]